jgi:nitrite reductase (NADH) small subunit
MRRHVVAAIAELEPGTVKIVEVEARSIGVIRSMDGRLYALRNVCPHHGAPLCLGTVTGSMAPSRPHEYVYDQDQSLIRCPWHGFSFRLEDGRSDLKPETLRVRTYSVRLEGDDVVVYM